MIEIMSSGLSKERPTHIYKRHRTIIEREEHTIKRERDNKQGAASKQKGHDGQTAAPKLFKGRSRPNYILRQQRP